MWCVANWNIYFLVWLGHVQNGAKNGQFLGLTIINLTFMERELNNPAHLFCIHFPGYIQTSSTAIFFR